MIEKRIFKKFVLFAEILVKILIEILKKDLNFILNMSITCGITFITFFIFKQFQNIQ